MRIPCWIIVFGIAITTIVRLWDIICQSGWRHRAKEPYLIVRYHHRLDRLHYADCGCCGSLESERHCTKATESPNWVRARHSSALDRIESEPWIRWALVAKFPECRSDVVHCEYDAKRTVVDIPDRQFSRLSSSTYPDLFGCTQQWRPPGINISEL